MLKPRQILGKYRVDARLAQGGFATVYRAFDTVEGIRVALKIPFPHLMTGEALEDIKREVRITAKLEHPNILPIKNADFIDDKFVIAYRLGDGNLDDRLESRIPTQLALSFIEQILGALAYAHGHRIIHCDVKPDNFILFAPDRLRLADFGIAKVTFKTLSASGSGTVGYVAPEQAMGRPSFRSDCFSAGLIMYRMLSGHLPTWPYAWPPPRVEVVRRKVHRDFIELLRRALEVDERKRFSNAAQMLRVFQRLKPRALAGSVRKKKKKRREGTDWGLARQKEFRRRFGSALKLSHACHKCDGPMDPRMQGCPWCGANAVLTKSDPTRFPARCKRCRRGIKLDWRFCAWCYGAAIGPHSTRSYTDADYEARCANTKCRRRDLMPFMRYCPWCHQRTKKKWAIPGSKDRCTSCGWGVAYDYWHHCPWCKKSLS